MDWRGTRTSHQISDSLHVYEDHFAAVADSLHQDRTYIPKTTVKSPHPVEEYSSLADLDRAMRILMIHRCRPTN